MIPSEIIEKKRDGISLNKKEIKWFINSLIENQIDPTQLSALLMAIYFKGMNDEETFSLVEAMVESGEKFDFNYICLEVRFVCLPKTVVKKMNEILGEYQIVMNKIFSYEYLNNLKSNKRESIFKIAENVLNKVNQNEVFLVNKNIKKHGFFEKFFNFFR